MKIKKEHLKTLWYEDKDGNFVGKPDLKKGLNVPHNAAYQISRFPNVLRTKYLYLIKQKDIDKCKHPKKHIKKTDGWADDVYGRKCNACGGTQTRAAWHLWPKKWYGCGSREVASANSSWSEDLVLVIANSGDYSLSEAIIIAATSCERCMNVLADKYGLDWGYEEGSEEWEKTGTSCQFCEEEADKLIKSAVKNAKAGRNRRIGGIKNG